jgi:DNA repair protein SbcC/Rad50
MLLKSIKLENIRSYVSYTLDFPIGSLLLSGDIGSGKSSILLAIEFALFGSKPNELPASSLLRYGKTEGSVELIFELDGKDVMIKRNLKKTKIGIKQEVGYILIDGRKTELSPVEMKSQIFNLLGYPKDLVTKGKDLIYRYTVYTPQEEMKRIISEDKELRLNTLRKVFNIDKYKKIRENISIFTKKIREKKRELEGYSSDLEAKKKEVEKLHIEIQDSKNKLVEIQPKIESSILDIEKKKYKIREIEEKANEIAAVKNKLGVIESEQKNLIIQFNNNNRKIASFEDQLFLLKSKIVKIDFGEKEILERKKLSLQKSKEYHDEHDNIKQQLGDYRIRKKNSLDILKKVLEIDKCPMCFQNVKHEHKESISEKENKIINHSNLIIKDLMVKEEKLKIQIEANELGIEELRKKENQANINNMNVKNLGDIQKLRDELFSEQVEIKKKIGRINIDKAELGKKVLEAKSIEENYKIIKEQLEGVMNNQQKLEIEKATIGKNKESLDRFLNKLMEDIQKKEESRKKMEYFSELGIWLDEHFSMLMGVIERNVMLRIYSQFNELFRTWFNIIIEDETLNVSIDEEFSPIIEQNGYDSMVENLSGGEKTAVALSYRLALNKVINEMVSEIKTKDLIMLDEPTDGFSSEQLDNVREVLSQLKIKQIILVSHETKIESYVDNVISLGKAEHISSIV